MAEGQDLGTMTFELLERMQGQLNRIEPDAAGIKSRLSHVKVSVAQPSLQVAELRARMNRYDERLGRIERRLDLTEA